MKAAYILRNVSHETAGSLEYCLAEAGIECRYFDLFRKRPGNASPSGCCVGCDGRADDRA